MTQQPAVYNSGVAYPANQVIDGNLTLVDVYGTGAYGNLTCRSVNAQAVLGMLPSGDPTGATDSAVIAAAIAAGQPVQLAPGTFTFAAPWPLASGTRISGAGRLATTCNWAPGASAIDMTAAAAQLDGVEITGLTMTASGAHLISGSWAARWLIRDCGLVQKSAGFSIWNAVLTGSQAMVECRFERNSEQVFGAVRTAPAWLLSGPGGSNQVNQCAWHDNACFNQNSDAAQYWYHIQNTGSNNAGNTFRNIVFEHAYGGMIWLESATLCSITDCFAYDVATAGGTISNHLIQLTKNPGGLACSRNRITGGPRNQSGVTFAAGTGDIGLDSACTATTILAPAASGNLALYLNGSKGVKLLGMPDGGFGIQDSAVTAAAGAAAGTAPPAPAVTAGPHNETGHVTFGTGAAPAAGAQVTVTFGTPFETTPEIMITPFNGASGALGLFPSASSPTGFSLSCANAPAASQATGTYGFRWKAEA